MVQLIKTIAKLAWYATTNAVIIGYLAGIIPSILALAPPYTTSVVITGVLGGVISTINWIFSPLVVKFAWLCWFTLPFVKLGLYTSYKITHV